MLGHTSRSCIIYGSYVKIVKSHVSSIVFDLFRGLDIALKVSVSLTRLEAS